MDENTYKGDIVGWLRRRSTPIGCMISGKLAGEIADHIEALQTDAARYRAIRAAACANDQGFLERSREYIDRHCGPNENPTPEQFDALTDYAMGQGAQQDADASDPTACFMADVAAELKRARAKFPGDRIMTIALAEEFGELAKAMLDESGARVWKEAVQTAVMAARVAIDGDSSVDDWRAAKGLDDHRNGGVVISENRRSAPYYVLIQPWEVYAKEGDFFRQQGGLSDDWGKRWVPVEAGSIEGAREMGKQMRAMQQRAAQ